MVAGLLFSILGERLLQKLMIIGAGSIGIRYWNIALSLKDKLNFLENKQFSVSLVSKHNDQANYKTIEEGIEKFQPTHILLASKTSDHFSDFKIINTSISDIDVLIEKPVFKSFIHINKMNNNYYVAYNLRFSNLISELKLISSIDNVLHAEIYVGSYLPDWRKNIDYRKNYSAKKDEGGGVLRDLSHELDYIVYLFGRIKKLTSITKKISDLEIDSEDISSIIMESESGTIITLNMNYISRIPIRRITMITNNDTYIADLILENLKKSNETKSFSNEGNSSYFRQLQSFLDTKKQICKIDEGLYITKLIESIEIASITEKWITI